MSLQSSGGPERAELWAQGMAYLSLGLSLPAAFGAVLGKQWLGHFRTSQFNGYVQNKAWTAIVNLKQSTSGIFDLFWRHYPSCHKSPFYYSVSHWP
ncbi:hypothetical protein M422DRAFT_164863 [Sphaerobolus stellatus SS14]|uniref:DUF6535 domain-containing protein n=1 Tax=Sphaerobolus stellatus (strain SS14) TaxID=990650 RepID=A0A0C9UUE4_SPHS4|nr:hypothetical protein M422DRAFT_164863 [Sphaerobolus stellatus SS14]